MTSSSPDRLVASMGLARRWPTALALLQVAAALYFILSEGKTDFASGIAAMACIYMAAYAAGRGTVAWAAYPGVVAVSLVMEYAGLDPRICLTVLLVALWIVAIGKGHARDGRWFAIQTSGMVFFGGLTLLALAVDQRAAGVLAGIGFFTHGLWDGYHFVRNKIVTRSWSEMCVVVDLIVGPALVVTALTS
jgi:hypothetical protein